MKLKFAESTIIENFIVEAKTLGVIFEPTDVVRICETLVAATADFLSIVKSKDRGVALTFDNVKNEMIMAGILVYDKNEEGEGQGNWNFYFTFDPKDLEEKTTYSTTNTQVHGMIARRAYENYRMKFTSQQLIVESCTIFANLLREFLDTNAKEGEEFVVEHDGYFLATASVENGVVSKSVLPDGAMKRLIKDDDAVEA